jgi:hypothetical protein
MSQTYMCTYTYRHTHTNTLIHENASRPQLDTYIILCMYVYIHTHIGCIKKNIGRDTRTYTCVYMHSAYFFMRIFAYNHSANVCVKVLCMWICIYETSARICEKALCMYVHICVVGATVINSHIRQICPCKYIQRKNTDYIHISVMHIYINTGYTCIHTEQKYIYTYMEKAYIQSIYTHVHVQIYLHTYIHTCMHTYIQIIHIRVHTYIHTYIHKGINT